MKASLGGGGICFIFYAGCCAEGGIWVFLGDGMF
jgi:hypothetical protein